MYYLRGSLSFLFAIIATSALSGFISLLAINNTALSQPIVTRWLAESGVYGKLVPELIDDSLRLSPTETTQTIVTPALVRDAISESLPAAYVQAQTEKVVSGTFAWLEGRDDAVRFALPLDEKREVVLANLEAAILPKVTALPPCVTLADYTRAQTDLSCRPQTTSAEEFTNTIATEALNDISLFNQPLTESQFTVGSDNSTNAQLGMIPTYRRWFNLLLMVLPLISIAGLLGVALVANKRRVSLMRVFRQIFLGAATTGVIGGMVYLLAPTLALPTEANQGIQGLATPVLRLALRDIAAHLAIYSIAPAAIGLVVWQVLRRGSKTAPPTASNSTPVQTLPTPLT
jgi:hypothetical protein